MDPISYDSLGTIIKHMEANQRFELVRRCPSLKNLEKNVPLTLDFLSVQFNYGMYVNNTGIYLSLYKHYHDGKPPKIVQEYNKEGCYQHDIDRWGFETPSDRFVKTPGDVIINPWGENWDEYNQQGEHYDDRKKRELQRALENLKMEMERGDSRHDDLEKRMEEIELQLLSYSCRENNTAPPYDTFIQCESNLKIVEMVQYTRKLHEAMKYFMNRILGGRRDPINVKRFHVELSDQIIRFPEGVKFKIREVNQMSIHPMLLDALSPVIDENSYPCKHLRISDSDLLNQPFTRNVGELTLPSSPTDIEKWSTLPNRKVNISDYYNCIESENCYELIKQFIDIRKRVGTCFKFIIEREWLIEQVFNLLRQRFGDEISFDERRAIVKMGNWSNIIVSHGVENQIPTPHHHQRWYINIEVVEGVD